MIKGSFTAADGKEIRYKEWTAENPKGMIQVSHGMSESLLRYEKFAEYMAENGYIVFGDDHRGHGETDPDRTGYTDGDMFTDTLSDIAALSDIYRAKYPNLKLVLFGHSYGSFLTQAYMEKYGDRADAFIVGGSAYMKGFQVTSGRIVAKLNCLFGKKKKKAKLISKLSFGAYNSKYKDGTTFISSLKEECDLYKACPDCNFDLSNSFYRSFFSALPRLYKKKNYKNIDAAKPIMLISGSDDPVGGYGKLVEKLYRFYTEKVGVKCVSKIVYHGVRHEYLNDASREAARLAVLEFCDALTEKKD
ncbi:MAG TPA: hypothetical protein DDW54_00820 [Clostridiales bacterium]|nr:hypothetical protein [Clostridiales bacterium]